MEQRRPRGRAVRQEAPADAFEEFQATVLFCNHCRTAQPVRERRLLYLPDGVLWEYLCVTCGASLGTRRTTAGPGGVVG